MKLNIPAIEIRVTERKQFEIVNEIDALIRCFDIDNKNSFLMKAVTLVLLLTWSVITLALTFESVNAVEPQYYGMMSIIVGLIIAKIWNIEIDSDISELK